MLALHQELGRDISRWFDFTGLFVLLMELLNPFLSGHHLKRRRRKRSHEIIVDKRKYNNCGLVMLLK